MRGEDLYWYWLNNIEGIGRKNIHILLEKFETPKGIYEADEKDIFSLKEIAKSKNIPIYQMKPKNNSFLLYPHKIDE